jgi:hypothetical protein
MNNIMKRLSHLFNTACLVGFLVLTGACNLSELVVKINTDHDQSAQFSQYRTYNWYQPEPTASSSGEGVNPSLQQHLKRAIEQEIAKKGLQKTTDNPQVLLAYDVSVKKPAQLPAQNNAAGTGYGYAYQVGYRYDYGHAKMANFQPVDNYIPGTLIIDVIDASSKELVWRGWAEDVVEDFNADYRTVENYVDDIIDKYPPKLKP